VLNNTVEIQLDEKENVYHQLAFFPSQNFNKIHFSIYANAHFEDCLRVMRHENNVDMKDENRAEQTSGLYGRRSGDAWSFAQRYYDIG